MRRIYAFYWQDYCRKQKKKGLSQPKLAELLSQQGIDVTAKAISKWETDAREPGLHVFLTLCKLLDIEDIYDAYFGKNPYSVMDGLNQEGKDKIKDYAKILKASGLFEPVVANIIPFRKKKFLWISSEMQFLQVPVIS